MNVERDEYERIEPRPRRRRRWGLVLACLFLCGLVAAEWAASHLLSAKLRTLVATKLDAELKVGTLLYLPPYGAYAWDLHLVRDGRDLFSADRVKLILARPPLRNEPIVIAGLIMTGPQLTLRPREFDGVVRPAAHAQPPRKLSELLELDKFRFYEGRVTYVDAAHPDEPSVWDGLSLEVETSRQTPSKYKFHVISHAQTTADASATGSIDVDELQLEINGLTLKGRAEPEPSKTPLPAVVQEVLKRYQLSGSFAVSGSGKIPLREPGRATLRATVALDDAAATLPMKGRPVALDHAVAALTVDKPPGGAVKVKVDRIDLGSEGRSLLVDDGTVTLDPEKGAWSVADVRGRCELPAPTRPPPPPEVRDGPEPVAPPPPGTNILDRVAPAGRFDFTAAASGPFRMGGQNPWETVRHEVMVYPRNASFQPKNFFRRIDSINGGEIRLVNGTVVFQELSGKYGDDVLLLHAARLPVTGLPKVQRWREISGVVAFHPPLRRYTPKLDKLLEALNPSGPFLVAGSWTNDKTGQVVKKDYDLIISSDTGSFTLTDRDIVLSNIRGDATAVPAGIDLRNVQADVLGGKAVVSGRWLRGEPFNPNSPASYEADVTLRDVDLAQLESRLADEPPRKPLKGRVYCDATISGELAKAWPKQRKLAAIKGDGQLEVVDGSLFQVPVLKQLASMVGLKDAATAGDAAATFTIADGKVKLNDAAVNSPVLGLQGGGTIDLADGGRLDLDIVGAPLADWRAGLKSLNVPVVGDVVSEVAGGVQKLLNTATGTLLYEFRAEGPAKTAKLTAVPAPVLTDTAAFVFGKMLAPPKKDQRPLDYLKRGQPSQEQRADLATERQPATTR